MIMRAALLMTSAMIAASAMPRGTLALVPWNRPGLEAYGEGCDAQAFAALEMAGAPVDHLQRLRGLYDRGQGTPREIREGEIFDYQVSAGARVNRDVIALTELWGSDRTRWAVEYRYDADGMRYALIDPMTCRNCSVKILPTPTPVFPMPSLVPGWWWAGFPGPGGFGGVFVGGPAGGGAFPGQETGFAGSGGLPLAAPIVGAGSIILQSPGPEQQTETLAVSALGGIPLNGTANGTGLPGVNVPSSSSSGPIETPSGPTPAPEPGSLSLLAVSGLGFGLAWASRRRICRDGKNTRSVVLRNRTVVERAE